MIYEADPNGHGYISYEAFEKIVTNYKQLKEDSISSPIGKPINIKVWRTMKSLGLIGCRTQGCIQALYLGIMSNYTWRKILD